MSILSFGNTIKNVQSTVTGSDINTECLTLRNEAKERIGQHQALLEWVNINLITLPEVCGGVSTIHYKDDRGNESEKSQPNNLTLWVLALDVLGFNKHVNYALLSAAFLNWSNDNQAGIDETFCKQLAKAYVAAMQELNIVSYAFEDHTVTTLSGEIITIKGVGMTPEFSQTLNDMIPELRERSSMLCRPLKHQPEDWTDSQTGVSEHANLQLITKSKLKDNHVEPLVLQAVNKLQKVKFVVAPCIIEAAKDMRKNKHLHIASGLCSKKETTEEAFRLYEEILKYQDTEGYHFPITMDTRGRMYYRGGLLSPQGVDFCKAAFQFKEAKPLGETGFTALCIHTANVFGQDKLSIEDRIKWTKDELMNIYVCTTHRDIRAKYPEANVFQALVTAHELQNLVDYTHQQDHCAKDFRSTLVCHQDGTCNGLQHMAAITGDRATAEAVNCVPSKGTDTPADVYGLVATEALQHVKTDEARMLIVKHGRDMAKNPVMVTSYGATPRTIKSNIMSYLSENKESIKEGNVIGDAYLSAIGAKAGAVTQLTESLKICVTDALHEQPNKSKFYWETADGFKVCTEYRQEENKRIRAGLLAAKMVGVKAPLDVIKTAGAMAPNFIHSIDATHLRMVVNGCNHDLVTVHDSIGSHACDFKETSKVIREKFVLVHCYKALENLCESMNQTAPEFDGDYRSTEAIQSAYIFS
jgi:DNA-directed RNA polymerase